MVSQDVVCRYLNIVFRAACMPLVLYNPQYSVASKVIWTIIIIAVTVALCVVSIEVYAQFLKSIEQMGL